jgi:hypothetical protein
MNDRLVCLLDLQVRELEPHDGFQRQRKRLVDLLSASPGPQILANLPQRTEHLRPIESLSRTMIAKA